MSDGYVQSFWLNVMKTKKKKTALAASGMMFTCAYAFFVRAHVRSTTTFLHRRQRGGVRCRQVTSPLLTSRGIGDVDSTIISTAAKAIEVGPTKQSPVRSKKPEAVDVPVLKSCEVSMTTNLKANRHSYDY